jgi:hypothetical protein
MPSPVLATATDPDGREIVLDEEAWSHVLGDHGEMDAHRGAVMATVARPDDRQPDPRPGRERFYRRGFGPARWLFVVVDFNESPARVVTAYGLSEEPPGWPSSYR